MASRGLLSNRGHAGDPRAQVRAPGAHREPTGLFLQGGEVDRLLSFLPTRKSGQATATVHLPRAVVYPLPSPSSTPTAFFFFMFHSFLKRSFFLLFGPSHVACKILGPQAGIKLESPALEKSLNPWAAREVPLQHVEGSPASHLLLPLVLTCSQGCAGF